MAWGLFKRPVDSRSVLERAIQCIAETGLDQKAFRLLAAWAPTRLLAFAVQIALTGLGVLMPTTGRSALAPETKQGECL